MINAVTACKILRFEIPNIAPPWPIPFAGARSAQVAHRHSKQIPRKLVLSKPPYNLRFFGLMQPGFDPFTASPALPAIATLDTQLNFRILSSERRSRSGVNWGSLPVLQ